MHAKDNNMALDSGLYPNIHIPIVWDLGLFLLLRLQVDYGVKSFSFCTTLEISNVGH